MIEPTDDRAEAERLLTQAARYTPGTTLEGRQLQALIGIGHALLAQDRDRCTDTRGHANGHHWPAEQPAATSSVD